MACSINIETVAILTLLTMTIILPTVQTMSPQTFQALFLFVDAKSCGAEGAGLEEGGTLHAFLRGTGNANC